MVEARPVGDEAVDPTILALKLLQQALENLDCSQAPANIGAHVDHAIALLEKFRSQANR